MILFKKVALSDQVAVASDKLTAVVWWGETAISRTAELEI